MMTKGIEDVIDDMERHVSGHEGAEDSPVARWAFELRKALGSSGHDPAADVSMSAYDLLPADEREAIAWVRERGGLDAVRGRLGERKRYLDRCRAYEDALDAIACSLGVPGDPDRMKVARALRKKSKGLSARLMPEGMERLVDAWPRFEDGEPVRIGDEFAEHGGCNNAADSIEIGDCWFKVHGFDGASCRYSKGASVKRPAPKVLDADGAEIRKGDTVWDVEFGCEFVVTKVADGTVFVAFEDVEADRRDPAGLTHRAPVLAADGMPLREGETVWHEDGTELRVLGFLHEEDDETIVKVERVSGPNKWVECRSLSLTHERPEVDSWERLEGDANACVCAYFDASVKDCDNCGHNSWECSYDKARDLVRRARALAGGA